MNITSGLINGLLLLGRLHPKSQAKTYDNEVFFEILAEDTQDISEGDKQSLEDWGWRLTRYEGLDVWDW